jgi:hypothetical protein
MDHAIWRRIKVSPSEATIPDAEQDKRLPEDLTKELGVLRDERGQSGRDTSYVKQRGFVAYVHRNNPSFCELRV